MSHNQDWVQMCYEGFQTAVEEGSMEVAENRIKDMFEFSPETARAMQDELKATKVNQWHTPMTIDEMLAHLERKFQVPTIFPKDENNN